VFRSETGQSPAKALENLRLETARLMMEQSRHPIEIIAQQTGFADRDRMRRAFLRTYGQPPQVIGEMPEPRQGPEPPCIEHASALSPNGSRPGGKQPLQLGRLRMAPLTLAATAVQAVGDNGTQHVGHRRTWAVHAAGTE
jgi:AraC-like DNA-binding protein